MHGPLLPPERRPLAALIALACLGLAFSAALTLVELRTSPPDPRSDLAKVGRFHGDPGPHR